MGRVSRTAIREVAMRYPDVSALMDRCRELGIDVHDDDPTPLVRRIALREGGNAAWVAHKRRLIARSLDLPWSEDDGFEGDAEQNERLRRAFVRGDCAPT